MLFQPQGSASPGRALSWGPGRDELVHVGQGPSLGLGGRASITSSRRFFNYPTLAECYKGPRLFDALEQDAQLRRARLTRVKCVP